MGKAINLFLVASLASMATALVESYFGVIAARSGSPINFLPMQARGLSLQVVLNGGTAHETRLTIADGLAATLRTIVPLKKRVSAPIRQ